MVRPRTILVVDDDPSTRSALEEILTDEGYEVFVASDGQQAIDLFTVTPTDLVLTDLRMPHVDGEGVLRHVRAQAPTVPVIVLTAHGSIDARRTFERLGANDFVNKPLQLDDMLQRIEKALSAGKG